MGKITIKCSRCGGSLECDTDRDITFCTYCGAENPIPKPSVSPRANPFDPFDAGGSSSSSSSSSSPYSYTNPYGSPSQPKYPNAVDPYNGNSNAGGGGSTNGGYSNNGYPYPQQNQANQTNQYDYMKPFYEKKAKIGFAMGLASAFCFVVMIIIISAILEDLEASYEALSISGFLIIASIAFGISGITNSARALKGNHNKRGFAIAGMVLSCIFVGLLSILFLIGLSAM